MAQLMGGGRKNSGGNGWIGSAAGRKGTSRQWACVLWAWETTGGGPSRADLAALQGAEGKDGGLESGPSTPEAYFAAKGVRLQKGGDNGACGGKGSGITGLLGCYTSQIRIKQKHRGWKGSFVCD